MFPRNRMRNMNSDKTVEKHANSDPELAEGPEFERGIGRFDTSTLLSAGKLNVRFIPFSTVSTGFGTLSELSISIPKSNPVFRLEQLIHLPCYLCEPWPSV